MGERLRKYLRQRTFADPREETLVSLMVGGYAIRDHFSKTFENAGLSPGLYNVLRILRGAGEEGRTRGEIAERLLERCPDVTRLVDRLVDMGYAERMRNRPDRRCSSARITKEGLKAIKDLEPAVAEITGIFGARFSEDEIALLDRLLDRLIPDVEVIKDCREEP